MHQPSVDQPQTDATRRRYDRQARLYDLTEAPMERLAFSRWRSLLWSRVAGPRVLEVGVGTGKNLPYYSPQWEAAGIDLSPKMVERARRRAATLGLAVELQVMDAQALAFPDASFDTVVATFVFCSVPDPVQGLREVRRVCRPGGQVLLLEHVLSRHQPARSIMQALNPIMVRVTGANINRETVTNVQRAGLEIVSVTDLFAGIVKLIEARA
ncbi:MAG: class I SAM-dependent methyltransferase [Chloroflexi bacterium]|nr:class I SAM-dependent methyltransferase [Chloroflexota bacterium]